MQLSNDASNTYNVLPLMRDLPRPRFLRLRWRSRDKIPRLNLPKPRTPRSRPRTPRSRRSRRSCAATHRVPSVHAAEPQWTRSLSQCALCVANGGTTPRIVGTSWTLIKLNSMWPRRTVTRRRRTWPSVSRLAKNQRLTPPLLLLIKPWRPLRPPRIPTTPRVMRLHTAACLIKSSCLIRPALYLIAARKSTSLKEPLDPAPAFNSPVSQALQSRPRERMPCFP